MCAPLLGAKEDSCTLPPQIRKYYNVLGIRSKKKFEHGIPCMNCTK